MSVSIQIQQLTLKNFRCYESQSWHISNGINVFVGDNGSGKTSILEAVYLMAQGRSFRSAQHSPWLRWGSSSFELHGMWHRYGPMHVRMFGRSQKVKTQLQGRPLSLKKELKETFPVLINSPQAGRLVDGDYSERRKWLDKLVMHCEPRSKLHYQAYLRALMQRSRLLRRQGHADELLVWEEQLVKHGRQVKIYRETIYQALNQYLSTYEEWVEQAAQCYMHSHIPDDDSAWLDALEQHRQQDRKTGRCHYGSHTDRLHFHYAQRDIKQVGSRGQQKLFSVALKLAECALRQDYNRIWPLLLLDDCFEALDSQRTRRLLSVLSAYPGQILLTSPQALPVDETVTVHHCVAPQRTS